MHQDRLPLPFRLSLGWPAAILALGLLLSLLGGHLLERMGHAEALAEFKRGADRLEAELGRRFNQPLYGLMGAKAVFAASEKVTRAEFRAFVEAQDPAQIYSGVRGFGFVQRVPRRGLERFIATERADGAPVFTVRQLDDRSHDDLYVIKFIEPVARNFAALGLDLGSEPARRRGLERAIDSGEPTLTDVVTLVQDARRTPGLLLFVPVYAGGSAPASPEQRRAALLGVVYAPLVVAEMLDGVPEMLGGQFDFELFDGGPSRLAGQAPLFDADQHLAHAGPQATAGDADLKARRFAHTRQLQLGGHDFTLRVSSTARFDAAYTRQDARWMLQGGGALVSLLLAALVGQLASGRRRAERLAERMTTDLERLAQVARHTSNGVCIVDTELRITWTNDGFTRLTGYGQDEALGHTVDELLGHGEGELNAAQILIGAATQGQACRVELQRRARDGRLFRADIELTPLRDAQGQLTGFMEIASDVTERHAARVRMEAALRATDDLLATLDRHALVSITDRSGRIISVNEAFCRVSGYRREELLGLTHRVVNSGTHPPGFWSEVWRSIAGGQSWRGEVCNRAKDGALYWVDSVITPLRGEDGRIERYLSIRHDITALKRAEQAQRRDNELLHAILDNLPCGLSVFNGDLELVLHNGEFRRLLDLPGSLFDAPVTRFDSIIRLNAERGEYGPGNVDDIVARTVERARSMVAHQFERQRPDGTVLDVRGVPLPGGGWVSTYTDVSAARQAEARVRESEHLMRLVTDSMPGRLAYFGPDQRLRFANRPTYEHFGGAPGSHVGRSFEDMMGPERMRFAGNSVAEVLAGLPQMYEIESPRADGTPTVALVHLVPDLRDGVVHGFVAMAVDVTQVKRAEQELRGTQSVLRGAIDAVNEGFVLYDPDDRLVFCNDKYRELYAQSADLIVPGATFEQIVRRGAERGQYAAAQGRVDAWVAERLAQHRAADTTLVQQLDDGRWLRIIERRTSDGHTVGFRIDITDLMRARHEAERASQEAARALARLQAIYDILPVGITITDPQGHIVDCNPASEKLLGISKAEHLARAHDGREWRVLREDGTPMPAEEFASVRALTLRQPVHDAVMQVLRPEGGVWLSVSATPMAHEELGVVIGYVDITEQRAQRQALIEAKQLAEQASVAKSRFLANMSHEIRTPMNAILGMLQLLHRTGLSPRQGDYTDKAERAARALLNLLNDILDFSKVEAGKMALDPRPFALDTLLRDLSVILAGNLGRKPVELLFDIDAAVPETLVADDLRLQQVLVNLGGNAIKFTPQGEVVLAVRLLERLGGRVRLAFSVRDTGIGIAPEQQQHIFSGFAQAEASTTRRFGGTGLGLAISQRIVELMGGTLSLDSRPGQGSCFSFELDLPVAAGDTPAPALPQAQRVPRALVVDDHPTARLVLERLVGSLGWRVDSAESGESALELARLRIVQGEPYEVVFVDWMMPDMDGWQTCRALRGLAGGQPPRLVMVTAHGDQARAGRDDDERAVIDAFVVKPVTRAMLRDAALGAHDAVSTPRHARARARRRLQGLRLLLVEDNANNQQVARELLEDEGARVQLASDGHEAVAAVSAEDHRLDLVLMDLQMPGMDGFEATRVIRGRPDGARLPIVAMTANAMAADREACLAAGMNDHVGKPFDLDELVRVILRHVATSAEAAGEDGDREAVDAAPQDVAPGAAAGLAEASAPAIDAALLAAAADAGVNLRLALDRMHDRVDIYQRMLRRFVGELAQLPAQLRAHADAGDAREVVRVLHTVKGVAAMLGADALAGEMAAAERQAAHDDRNAGTLAALARQAADALVACAGPLQALLHAAQAADQPVAPASEADAQALRAALRQLVVLLQNGDMAATDLMGQLRRSHGGALGQTLTPLDDAVANLEFERAAGLCQSLLEGV